MLAHEDISEVSAILKKFKKRDYGLELSDINKNLLILNKVESKLLVEKGNIPITTTNTITNITI